MKTKEQMLLMLVLANQVAIMKGLAQVPGVSSNTSGLDEQIELTKRALVEESKR